MRKSTKSCNEKIYMNAPLIILYGPDGAGKSIHAKLIMYHLKKNGFNVKKAWIKSPTMLSLAIVYFIEIIDSNSIVRSPTGGILSIRGASKRINKRIWQVLELSGFFLKTIITVYIPIILGYVVIADRFVIDSIVHLTFIFRDTNLIKNNFTRIMLSLIPKDSIIFFIDASCEELIKRRGILADPKIYLCFSKKFFYIFFPVLRKRYKIYYIDTTKESITATFGKIRKYLQI